MDVKEESVLLLPVGCWIQVWQDSKVPAHCHPLSTSSQAVWGSGSRLYTGHYPLKPPRACFLLCYHLIQSTESSSIMHATAEAWSIQDHAGTVYSSALDIFNDAVRLRLAPAPPSFPSILSLFHHPGRCPEFACGYYANQKHIQCPAYGPLPLAPPSGAWDDV